jgi:hypothetical protein
MTLEEYARQQAQQRAAAPAAPELHPERGTAPAAPPAYNQLAAAQKIIAEHKQSHEIAEGCRLQILQSLEQRENPYKLLLLAAEAIGRLDFMGDTFFLQVQQKLIDVYGRDVSEDTPEGQKTA